MTTEVIEYLRFLKSNRCSEADRAFFIRQFMRQQTQSTPTGRGNRAVRRLNEMRPKSTLAFVRGYGPVVAFNTPGDKFLTRRFRGHRGGIA